MLAAAGNEGLLSRRTALLVVLVTVIFIFLTFVLARYGSEESLVPLEASPEELQVRARDIVQHLGYSVHPQDSFSWLERDDEYLQYQALHQPSTRWYQDLNKDVFTPVSLWYRQSPRFLIPRNGDYIVKKDDPPLDLPGMVSIRVSSRGKLLEFWALPPRIEEVTNTAVKFDWQPLFDAAGLDQSHFKVVVPKQVPPVPFDDSSEWDSTSRSGTPIHVAAAAWRGKAVYFEVSGSWSHTVESETLPSWNVNLGGSVTNAETYFLSGLTVFVVLSVFIAGMFFARRNLRMGRGDKTGALQEL